jgi:hypothetical protein
MVGTALCFPALFGWTKNAKLAVALVRLSALFEISEE